MKKNETAVLADHTSHFSHKLVTIVLGCCFVLLGKISKVLYNGILGIFEIIKGNNEDVFDLVSSLK